MNQFIQQGEKAVTISNATRRETLVDVEYLESVDLDNVPMPQIKLASLKLNVDDLRLAEGILDSDGRLQREIPAADSPPKLPLAAGMTRLLWYFVSSRLSPRDIMFSMPCDAAVDLLSLDQRAQLRDSLDDLAFEIAYSVPAREHYGEIRLWRLPFFRKLREREAAMRKRYAEGDLRH